MNTAVMFSSERTGRHHKRYLMNLMLSFTSRLMCAPMNRIANVHDTSHPKLMDFIETGLMTCAG